MKTTSRGHRPSLNQLHVNMSTSFGQTSHPNAKCPVTTTFGNLWRGDVPLTVKNLGFISRLNLLRWNFPPFAVTVLLPARLSTPALVCCDGNAYRQKA